MAAILLSEIINEEVAGLTFEQGTFVGTKLNFLPVQTNAPPTAPLNNRRQKKSCVSSFIRAARVRGPQARENDFTATIEAKLTTILLFYRF